MKGMLTSHLFSPTLIYYLSWEKLALLAIDDILEVLQNGEWHTLKEIAEKKQLRETKLKLIMSFLAEYDFIRLDLATSRIRLSPQLLNFLKKIQDLEREEAIKFERSRCWMLVG